MKRRDPKPSPETKRARHAGRVWHRVGRRGATRAVRGQREPFAPRGACFRPAAGGPAGMICSFGATRVGGMLDRLRLHLATQRFLAGRRGDLLWEAGCDYAALALERLASRMRPGALGAPTGQRAAAGRGGPR